jgi:hypothetical protein
VGTGRLPINKTRWQRRVPSEAWQKQEPIGAVRFSDRAARSENGPISNDSARLLKLWEMTEVKTLLIGVVTLSALCATGTLAAGPLGQPSSNASAQASSTDQVSPETYSDPLAPFNEKIFWFNLKLDKYVLRPVATGYADVLPEDVRQHVGNFWDNVGVIPRVANNLFQLKIAYAGQEVGRFFVNSTLGGAGFFDVANPWFGWKEHDQDFGLTLGPLRRKHGPLPGAAVLWTILDSRRSWPRG